MKDNHDTFKELYEARHEPENLRPIAETYWRVLLFSSLIAAVGIILFGIWQFSSVMTTISSTSSGSAAQQAPAIDRAQLEEVLVQFSERRANFELGRTMVPVVADPTKAN
ncbi:MAG: hypothetical protein KBD06_02535 [Candidatus Pacebacteria bacterium]|nr:hypothetical protein [Candidatus Paceibacterota bacterium]